MKAVFAISCWLLAYSLCLGQDKSGNAKTSAQCSPAVTGNNNTFIFQYCGPDLEEGKRMVRLLDAISKGQDLTNTKLDEILSILGQPTKINVSKLLSEPPKTKGAHATASIEFYTEDPVERGQFEITCDRACTPSAFCALPGTNAGNFAIVIDHPEIAEFLFQRQFPPFIRCTLTVESFDEKPVKIIDLKTSRRTQDIRFPKKQPSPTVWAGGSVMG